MQPILDYLFESSICLMGFYVFYHLILRELPSYNWNRFYFLIAYFISLILPFLSLKIFPVEVQASAQNIVFEPEIISDVQFSIMQMLSIKDILLMVYGLGLIVFLGRFVSNMLSIRKMIISGEVKKSGGINLLRISEGKQVFSFMNYLFVPKDVKVEDEIYQHELIHMRQHHTFDLLLSQSVKTLLWFNPFAYLMQKSIKLNHEFICDTNAATKIGTFKYAQFLGSHVSAEMKLLTVNNFSYKIKNRLIMLQKREELKHKKWRYLLIFPLLTIALNLFSFEEYYVAPSTTIVSTTDSIPLPLLKRVTVIDTVVVFDIDSKTENQQIIKHDADYVVTVDTVLVFDYDTKKEKSTVVRREQPLNEYLEENNIKGMRIDTLTIFDNETLEGTRSVYSRIASCYWLEWGNKAFSGSIELLPKEVVDMIEGTLTVKSDESANCQVVNTYSLRVIFVAPKKDPKVVKFDNDNKDLGQADELIPLIQSNTRIFIEDLSINGADDLEPIVIYVK